MPDVNTPRYPAFAASGSQAFAAGGQPFAPGSQPFAAIPNGAQRPVQPASITPRAGNGLPQGPFPLQVRPAGNLPVALNGARQAPASLTGTAVEDFFKGSITTGLLATLQQKSHQPQGHHVAAIAGKLNRTTLRLALQGGVALAAGTASARALRQSRPGAALLAAALGAGGVLLAERYLKDRQAAPRTEAVDLPADDPISLAEAALAQAAAHDAPEVNFEAADSPRASSASDIDIDETEAATPAA